MLVPIFALVAIFCTWFLFRKKSPVWRKSLWLTAVGIGFFCFFFFEEFSREYAGYSRFHLLTLLAFGVAAFFGLSQSLELFTYKQRWAFGSVFFGFCVAVIPAHLSRVHYLSGADERRNFIEHRDAPVYLPLRTVWEKAEQLKSSRPIRVLTVFEKVAVGEPFSSLGGNRDIDQARKVIRFAPARLDECACGSRGPAFFVPLYGLRPERFADHKEAIEFEAKCMAQLKARCSSVESVSASVLLAR